MVKKEQNPMLLPFDDDPQLVDPLAQMGRYGPFQPMPLLLQNLQQPAGMAADSLALAAEIIADRTSPMLILEEHQLMPGIFIIHHI